MNRTEQASEPTMEEILASIRLIISDDAKKAPPARDDQSQRAPAPMPDAAAAPLNRLPAEDVLDLTDELVFPEERPAPAAASSAAPRSSQAAAAEPDSQGEGTDEDDPGTAMPPHPSQPAETQYSSAPHRASPDARGDFAQPPAPAQSPSRTVWSRRELPGSPAPVAAAAPRFSPEPAPSRQQLQKSWGQDVHMAIPDRGPVSLIPGQVQAHAPEPEEAKLSFGDVEEENAGAFPGGLGDKEESGVAALTEDLIRSAVSAMDTEELATAAGFDFGEIDSDRKAEVTEKFASVLQREHISRDKGPPPSLLDEMLRQDLPSKPGKLAEPDRRSAVEEEPDSAHDERVAAFKSRFDAWSGVTETAPQLEDSKQAAPQEAPAVPQAVEAPAERKTAAPAQVRPVAVQPVATAVAVQPVVSVAAVQPAAPSGGRTLEDAVRDMLRPLLAQWLNENMPRILESAIREEMAARGLPLNAEK